MPTNEEIDAVKNLLRHSFTLLNNHDSDLIDITDFNCHDYNDEAIRLERKLHEVCINHRLAHYIENLLPYFIGSKYHVDIEYNRFYRNPKYLQEDGSIEIVRPDIIVHTRAEQRGYPQHLIVIEAKKTQISDEDTRKVRSFLTDQNYNYVFGITIKYGNFDPIEAILYYQDIDGVIRHCAIN